MFPWTFITGIVTGFVDDWKAKRQNQRDIEAAVAQNKVRLAQSTESHNADWEMKALEGRDTWLRRLSFTAWSAPLLWAYFDPVAAALYFTQSLGALPSWYVGGYLAITGAVWGISELKSSGVLQK